MYVTHKSKFNFFINLLNKKKICKLALGGGKNVIITSFTSLGVFMSIDKENINQEKVNKQSWRNLVLEQMKFLWQKI